MKKNGRVQTEPFSKSVCSWHARIVALLSIAMLFGTSAFAEAQDNNDIPELPGFEVKGLWKEYNLTAPVAVKVVKPEIPERMVGTNIRMIFRINKNGKAYMIRDNASPFDNYGRDLGAMMSRVLREWKFSPPRNKQSQPVEVTVALPVRVVEHGLGNVDQYAQIVISEPILLAVLDR